MGVQPCWNQTKIINTSRHQQLLTDPAHRGPRCWLIPKGKNELWFPSSPRTPWRMGAECTADASGHKAGGDLSLREDVRGGDPLPPAIHTAVHRGNSPCWFNPIPTTTGVNKEIKKYIFKSPVVCWLGMK